MSTEAAEEGMIKCEICGALAHTMHKHLKDHHPDWTVERYQSTYQDAPLLSAKAEAAVKEHRAKQAAAAAAASSTNKKPMHQLFGLPAGKTTNPRGEAIMVRFIDPAELDDDAKIWVPDIDPNYVFNIELTKNCLMGYELGMTQYSWGLHGTGKSTLPEQVAARTGRPFIRVQHTINTEEGHILGQWMIKNKETVFSLGPLPTAMLNGYVYCADEYDVAMPSVTAVYQPVLEGKALIIKEAPAELRVIRPHPNFRFVATGNTNGCGDETGLYQGTNMQNAAQYSRFAITVEVDYPEPKVEAAIVAGQSGAKMDEAQRLVSVATEIRKSFRAGNMSATISPRELINAAKLALIRGGNWREGLNLAFINRLSRTDKEVCKEYAQRVFGAA